MRGAYVGASRKDSALRTPHPRMLEGGVEGCVGLLYDTMAWGRGVNTWSFSIWHCEVPFGVKWGLGLAIRPALLP